MSFIDTIPLDQAQDDVLDLYQRQQQPLGFVPNYAKVWCYRPELMQAWANLQRGIKKRVDYQHYELVTFAAALAMGNSGCSLAHAKVLRDQFYSSEEMLDIVATGGKNTLTEQQQAMVKFVGKVVGKAADITAEDVESLRATGCSEADIFDVVMVASARCFFAKIHDALGVLVDAPFADGEQPLTDRLLVGRPVSQQPVECL